MSDLTREERLSAIVSVLLNRSGGEIRISEHDMVTAAIRGQSVATYTDPMTLEFVVRLVPRAGAGRGNSEATAADVVSSLTG